MSPAFGRVVGLVGQVAASSDVLHDGQVEAVLRGMAGSGYRVARASAVASTDALATGSLWSRAGPEAGAPESGAPIGLQ